MSAESTSPSSSPNGTLKVDSVDLDNVFTPPTRDEWLKSALAGLPNHESLDSLEKHTLDGLTIQVLYDASNAAKLSTNLQPSTTASASDNRLFIEAEANNALTNKKILDGLNGGNSSLHIQLTDSADLSTILSGVKLELATISLQSGSAYAAAANAYIAFAQSQSLNEKTLQCSFNADPVGTWLKDESAPLPSQESLKSMASFSRDITTQLPLAHTVLVDVAQHHNAGASAQQELTASMATAALYLEALLNEGLSLEQASDLIVFHLACDADVLMGIVKIRSLKGLWLHLLSEFAAANNTTIETESINIHIVVETSKRYLSKQDHWNNHLRNIAACTAAAMGSASTIMVHPHDKVQDWQATEDSSLGERIARNLPIILDRECGLSKVTDPMAGSFAIETLTEQLMELTWQSLSVIDTGDAWINLLANGKWQQELTDTHTRRVQHLHDEASIMVGVNRFNTPMTATAASNESTMGKNPIKARLKNVRDAQEFDEAAMLATQTGENS